MKKDLRKGVVVKVKKIEARKTPEKLKMKMKGEILTKTTMGIHTKIIVEAMKVQMHQKVVKKVRKEARKAAGKF